MAARIDHSGHPHPSTPTARQLCRANGGTGSTTKTGTKVPESKRLIGPPPTNLPPPPQVLQRKPSLTESKIPVARPVVLPPAPPKTAPKPPSLVGGRPGEPLFIKPAGFNKKSMQILGDDNKWHNVAEVDKGSIISFKDQAGETITSTSPAQRIRVRQKSVAARVVPTNDPGPLRGHVNPPAKGTGGGMAAKVDKSVNPALKKALVNAAKIQESILGSEYVDKAVNEVDQPPLLYKDLPSNDRSNSSFAVFTFAPRKLSLHHDLHNRSEELHKCSHSGWFAPGGDDAIENVLAHELGHSFISTQTMDPESWNKLIPVMIDQLGLTDTRPPDINPAWGRYKAQQEAEDWFFRTISKGHNKHKMSRGVSSYSSFNFNEFMAEVWQSYSMNPKPNKKVKALGDVMKDIMTSGGTTVISDARR